MTEIPNEMTDKIASFQKDTLDISGNKIINILAKGNEYVIYEIDDVDINNRLKVFIDGHNSTREEELIQKFNKVKQNYFQAKGLLYRSSNFGMMKNRIAHLLTTVFTSDDNFDGNREFEKLINEIQKEYSRTIRNRLFYLAPAISASLFLGYMLYIKYQIWFKEQPQYWIILCILFGSAIGGTVSLIFRINKHNFEEHLSWMYYVIIGLERTILAIFAGIIAYVGIKSGILFGNIENKSYWTIVAIAILAGFSEALIPGLLSKISNDNT